jgi:prepilin-type N-terminal cleavage/methylation domain-containing protein
MIYRISTIEEVGSHSNRIQRAFTIVELLIVIVVIAILAAISIVAYNGIQNRARESAADSALNQAVKKIAMTQVDSGSASPQCIDFYFAVTSKTDLTNDAACVFSKDDIGYQYKQTPAGGPYVGYCITATSGKISRNITNTGGLTEGACPGHGSGGVDPVTNLVVNPSLEVNANGWHVNWGTGGTGTSVHTNDSTALCGSRSFRMTWSSAPAVTWGGVSGISIPVSVGKVYTGSIWIKSNTAQQLYLILRPNTHPTDQDRRGSVVSVAANTWTRLTVTTDAIPAGITHLTVSTVRNGSGSWQPGNVVEYDCMMVNEGQLHGFADGSSAGWSWNGNAGNSTSVGPPL